MNTALVENYPGFPEGIMGPELMANMRKQAEKLGVEIVDKNASGIQANSQSIFVFFGKSEIQTKAVIIAVGAAANTLQLPGEDRLMGRGVGTCAVCDAPFYRGAEMVFVVGGGDSAVEEAAALAKYSKEVVILVRKDKMRAAAAMQDRIKQSNNIKIWYKSEALEFLGEKKLEQVKIIRGGKESVISANGLFYAIGHTPATGWLKDSGIELDEKGYIITNLKFKIQSSKLQFKIQNSQTLDSYFPTSTSVPGVFAAGDCADPRYWQAVTAAGAGAMAALDAQRWLETTS